MDSMTHLVSMSNDQLDLKNAAMLIRRLCQKVEDWPLKQQALDWVQRKGLTGSILREEESAKDNRNPWVKRLDIFRRQEGNWWVRWCGIDGIYRWLHPENNQWIEEQNQIDMPLFGSELLATLAAEKSPEPPTWAECVKQ